ncbi:MAG: ATP phosphoribosyltransferase [Candidatus Aminicenantes bacterium]|jgi:ATP phosphoribosyltransferase
MRGIRIGVGKGRGIKGVIQLLKHSNIDVPASFGSGKQLVVQCPGNEVILALVRHSDLPQLLLSNYIDIAIASNLSFIEADDPRLICAAELKFGQCRLSLLQPVNREEKPIKIICTRYPDIVRRYYPDVDIIPLSGCNEIAVILGFSDAVVDVVETGTTIKVMGLEEVQTLENISHSIWLKEGKNDCLSWVKQRISNLT